MDEEISSSIDGMLESLGKVVGSNDIPLPYETCTDKELYESIKFTAYGLLNQSTISESHVPLLSALLATISNQT